ncbi:hypothetical protein Acr_19g0009790 [Actinidia rufa]|uniref:Uncharacterized protein n=1 Tax=Actinidia rufa TaxID=165716 RepID=A0A7J0GBC4_9ERIC|nr:hypothetical protein Acr_19g0009790 [Actinidia rufa]
MVPTSGGLGEALKQDRAADQQQRLQHHSPSPAPAIGVRVGVGASAHVLTLLLLPLSLVMADLVKAENWKIPGKRKKGK